ncbi:THUMP domain-containing protein [Phyllosticta capitalensis]
MAGDNPRKRKAPADNHGFNRKGKKQWRKLPPAAGGSIEAGDSGIWASCAMGREGKAVAELRDTFDQYCKKLYGVNGDGTTEGSGDASDEEDGGDIEAEIKKEIEGIRKPTKEPLFRSVRIETDCIMFFKTRSPIDPVEFVRRICEDAMAASAEQKAAGRFVKRLTPMTLMGKATENGLEEVAKQVLAPHFHGPENAGKKFAIRPNVRNHKTMTRDTIIRTVAAAVGQGHSVDLKNYDLLILVDIYKNMCGISVVGEEFERLKRFNLSEIYEPSPKEQPKESEA